MADTDYQAMLRKFLQYYPQGGDNVFPGGAVPSATPNSGLPQQNFNQRFAGSPMGQGGIGSDAPLGGGNVPLPAYPPMPQARPNMGMPQPQFDQRFAGAPMGPGIGVGLPQNAPMPQARPNIPMQTAQPPMPQSGGLAGLAPGQPMPLGAGGPGLFQRSAMMQTDPNTGQPIDPQAAALAQALMNRPAAA